MTKKIFILAALVFLFTSVLYAGFQARLLSDPYYAFSGLKCEKFVTQIKVQGLFYETSIQMKVKLCPYHTWQGCIYPREGDYEFTWVFTLPEESIITECLVWDENRNQYLPSQAIDLTTGEALYDPNSPDTPQLLLREYRGRNSSGYWSQYYRLKLAPVDRDETKELIIKYISPCYMYWGVRRIVVNSGQFYYPGHRYCVSDRKPAEFKLIDFDNPDQPPRNIYGMALTWQKQGEFWYTQTGPDDIEFNSYAILRVDRESSTGKFLQTYSDGIHQFYQVATLPHVQSSDLPARHIIVAFDLIDEDYYYNTSRDRIIDDLFYPMKYGTTEKDSLAFVTSSFTVNWLDNDFVARTTDLFSSRFETIKNIIPRLSTLPFMLREAVQFLNNRNLPGEIWLISNATQHSNPPQTALDIIQQTHFAAKNPIKFRIVDATFGYGGYIRVNNQHYRGNEYLYENLTRLSRGTMITLRNENDYNRIDALMDCLTPVVSSVEIDPIPDQGLSYSRIPINWDRKNFNITSRFFEIGLFDGQTPFQLEYYGILNDELYAKEFTFEPNDDTFPDSILKNVKTFWYAQYIDNLLKQPQSYATIKYIEQLSVENHILSPYVGFILPGKNEYFGFQKMTANDTLLIEETPEEVVATVPDGFVISAFPNPFNPATEINIDVPECCLNTAFEIRILNTLGQTIRSFRPGNTHSYARIKIKWDGQNDMGQHVASGIYFIFVKAANTIRYHKITLLR